MPADTGQEVAAGADATKLPSSKVGTSDEIELSPGESRETSIMVSLPEQALGDREWNFRLGFYSSQELDISFRALDARARQVGLLTELNEWLRTALVEILSAVERIVQWSAKTATVPRWTLAYLVPIALIVCGVIGAQTTGSSTNASTPSARQSAPSNTPLTARSGAPSTLEIHAGDLKCDGRWIVLLARSSDHADIAYFFGRANSARTLGEIEYTQISTDCAGLRTGEWVLFAGTFGSEAESELAVTRSGVDGTVLQLR
ncbi:hypothetical protein BCD48_31855 [Pseudofrankia sp. BMG5.36]|nr:hypothetical protein BCD48_31855 [Pseudofrankia sp. BMG5.36]